MSGREAHPAGRWLRRATGYPLQVQWTLIEGVNDMGGRIERRIPPTLPERAAALARAIHSQGVLTKLRQSARSGRRRRLRTLRVREHAMPVRSSGASCSSPEGLPEPAS